MTAPRPNRRWWRLLSGLLGVAGLVSVGPAAGAELAASSVTGPLALTWSTVSPPVTPPPLAYASAVYDSDNKTVVLFGGARSNGTLSDDTWVWNGFTWTDYPGSEVQAPLPRRMASMAFDPTRHQLILFGGQGADGQPLRDTWAWNGVSWYEQTDLLSQSPSAREGATMGYDGAGHVVLFGGTGSAGTPSPAPPSPTATTAPGNSTGSAGVGTGSSPSTTGPATPLHALADTWLWTGDKWTPATAGGPPARSGASIAFDSTSGTAVLFGGVSTPSGSTSTSLLNDSWAWTGTSWEHLAPKVAPPPRDYAAMTADGLTGGPALFGGSGARGALGDTWLWNGSSWASARIAGAPSPRVGAAAAFDATSHQLVLFGGIGPGGAILGDTVILTGQAPVALGSGPAPASRPPTGTRPTVASPSLHHRARVSPPASSGTPTSIAPLANPPGVSSPNTPLVAATHVLHRGDLVALTGTGFRPGAIVTITFHSTPTVVGRAVANQLGGFSATVAVPEAAAGGAHHFEAAGLGRKGQLAELIATVEVVGVPGESASSSTMQRAVLTATAVLIPTGTWCILVGAGRWRRRRAAVR